ncbi:hypothetical protein EST38_g7078 [Candolleomyces aberdarensis]|uniref:MYND-type domain-containing protein n=1 Tax=Candolleomyces aberdarensis TaxID=2316362 RepID=A0A4Q2DI10_9AGAR|nr:hypothetical protein EST38_g7078 [Candolleomyces aberdarensis]
MSNHGKSIPQQVIDSAYEGSIQSLLRLRNAVGTHNCTVDVAKVALKHLHLDLTPRIVPEEFHWPQPQFRDLCQRGTTCMSIMLTVAIASHKYPSLEDKLLDELLGSIDDICAWVNSLLTCQMMTPVEYRRQCFEEVAIDGALLKYSIFFSILVQGNPQMKNAIVSTPAFGDLLLRFWTAKDQSGQLWILSRSLLDASCHLVCMMLKALKTEHGREVILQRIHFRNMSFAFQIATVIMERAAQVASPTTCELHRGLELFEAFMRVVQILTTQSSVLRKQFIKIGYLKRLTSILNALGERVSQEDCTVGNLQSILTASWILCQHLYEDNIHPICGWRDVVEGGFVTMILRVLSSLPDTDDAPSLLRMGVSLLDLLSEYISYNTVVKKLPKSPFPQHLESVTQRDPLSVGLWREFWAKKDVSSMLSSTIDEVVPSLCDNQPCQRPYSRIQFKRCSRCNSVIYCSKQCQREDWKRLHRAECLQARGDYFMRKPFGAWYSHSNRRLHLAQAQAYYDKAIDAFYENPNDLGSPYFVVIMDFTTPDIKFSLEALYNGAHDDVPTWDPLATLPAAQSHLKPRFQALMGKFQPPQYTLTTSRLVELIIPFGERCTLILTVWLDRLDESWVASTM